MMKDYDLIRSLEDKIIQLEQKIDRVLEILDQKRSIFQKINRHQQRVYEIVRTLQSQNKPATRKVICELAGIDQTVIYNTVISMLRNGLLLSGKDTVCPYSKRRVQTFIIGVNLVPKE